MKHSTIKATFRGKDSLGYKNGVSYMLYLNKTTLEDFKKCPITIEREDGSGVCPYSSYENFKANWEIEEVQHYLD